MTPEAGRTRRCGRPRRVGGGVVLAAALALGLSGCPGGSPAEGPDGDRRGSGALEGPLRVTERALFAAPAAEGEEEQNSTVRRLVEMVERTPPGETIRIVAHSFSLVPVAEALAAAHERGVRVQVISDRNVSGTWKAPGLLREALGTNRRASSFLYLAPGKQHQKSWTFTRTGGVRDVSMVGSMNLTYVSSRQFNDVVTYVDRPRVRRVLDRRFEQLLTELPEPSPRTTSLGLGRGDRAWFYPTTVDDGDPVRAILESVPPAGARIRVVMYAWLQDRGMALAQLLVAKAAAGAEVEVVLGRSVGSNVREILDDTEVVVRDGVLEDADPHSKLTVVSYPDAGAPQGRSRFVLTGSDNYTSRSLTRPELLLRLDGDTPSGRTRHAAYEQFVDRLVARIRRES